MTSDHYSWSAERWELVHCKTIWLHIPYAIPTTWSLPYNCLWVSRVRGSCACACVCQLKAAWSFWTWTLLQREIREPESQPRLRMHLSVLQLSLSNPISETHSPRASCRKDELCEACSFRRGLTITGNTSPNNCLHFYSVASVYNHKHITKKTTTSPSI